MACVFDGCNGSVEIGAAAKLCNCPTFSLEGRHRQGSASGASRYSPGASYCIQERVLWIVDSPKYFKFRRRSLPSTVIISHWNTIRIRLPRTKASHLPLVVKNLHDGGDMDSVPESGRFLGEGNGNPLWYSRLENSMDRVAWQATVRGVTKSRTLLRVWAQRYGN